MLGAELARYSIGNPIVLALPRGGVPVACEVAITLRTVIDVLVVKKIPAPINPELSVAAIVDGEPPDVVLNREIIEAYDLQDDELYHLVAQGRADLEAMRSAYRGTRRHHSVKGRNVIVVDDGAHTGVTMKMAVRALIRRSPLSVVVALPVSSPEAAEQLRAIADRFICLSRPTRFRALSYHYREFPRLGDDDVRTMLADVQNKSFPKGQT